MLRLWTSLVTLWGCDWRFDRIARERPVRAALVVGLVFGLVEWLLAAVMAASLLPFAALLGASLVGACTFGPIMVWLRPARS